MSDHLEALSIKGWRLEIMKWVATRLTKILNISWNKESLKVIIKLELTLKKRRFLSSVEPMLLWNKGYGSRLTTPKWWVLRARFPSHVDVGTFTFNSSASTPHCRFTKVVVNPGGYVVEANRMTSRGPTEK